MENFNIAGLTFLRDRSPEIGKLRPVGAVAFEAEPDNAHDPGAVKVLYRGEHVGYVPRGDFQAIALKRGIASILEYIYLGDKEKYPPKGWNSDNDGILQCIKVGWDQEEEGGRVIGGKYLRVTTFLKFFDPYCGGDGLIKWAFKQAVEGYRKEDDLDWKKLYDGYRAALNKTAEAGTEMHDNIERYLDTGERGELPEGWDAFEKKYEPEMLSAEIRFYDNKLMVSGQYDFLGYITIKGARVLALLDWKSSKKPSIKHRLQVSIYAYNVRWQGERPACAMVVAFGADNNQRYSASTVTLEQIESNYMGMRHVRAAMDACNVWVSDEKYI
jgi:hypothetical protein